jgi:subtilase family serine protease
MNSTTPCISNFATLALLLCILVGSLQAQTVTPIKPGGPLVIEHKNLRTLNLAVHRGDIVLPDSFCVAVIGIHCYSPQQMRHAYGVDSLINAGFTGAGQTIVIIDSFGSPTIEQDLKDFDAAYGVPDPPSFRVLAPLGTVPFDPTDFSPNGMVDWALETTLDVEWAHAMAPGASILLLTSPVNETQGVQGMPEFLFLEQYALNNHLGKIISQSWGTTENTLFDAAGQQVFRDFERFYQRAREEKVSVFAGSGDSGAAGVDVNNNFFPFPVLIYPASSPNVTAVGGTSLSLDNDGNRISEITWNSFGATGGGVSQQFSEPEFQRKLPPPAQLLLHGKRAIPDVAYNADPLTAVSVPFSFLGFPALAFVGGTSAGAPQWAGVTADINQFAGRPIGFLNDKLYKLGREGQTSNFFHDITVGNNSFVLPGLVNVQGFSAGIGWDAVTGWGTPKLDSLIPAIAKEPDDD